MDQLYKISQDIDFLNSQTPGESAYKYDRPLSEENIILSLDMNRDIDSSIELNLISLILLETAT